MVIHVLEVNKSILRGFRAIRVNLVLEMININNIVSKIATPIKAKNTKRLYIG